MGLFSIDKVVSALPGTLVANCVYAVRVGVGFDLYIADTTGSVAHKINPNISTYVTRQTLTDGATIAYDIAGGRNARVTLGGNRALANLVDGAGSPTDGESGHLLIIQDGTGTRSLSKPSNMTMVQGDFSEIALMAAGEVADLTWISTGAGATRGWLVIP
jgi:hypothetical protein